MASLQPANPADPAPVGEEPVKATQPDPAFFPDTPFPSALTKPKGLKQYLLFAFHCIFNQKKIMTPLERSVCELLDRLDQQVAEEKLLIKEVFSPGQNENQTHAPVLVDGKPYHFTYQYRTGTSNEYHLKSDNSPIELSIKDYCVRYDDPEEQIKVVSSNNHLFSRAKKTFKRIHQTLQTQGEALRKQQEMEKLKLQLELEKQANAGKKLRF